MEKNKYTIYLPLKIKINETLWVTQWGNFTVMLLYLKQFEANTPKEIKWWIKMTSKRSDCSAIERLTALE